MRTVFRRGAASLLVLAAVSSPSWAQPPSLLNTWAVPYPLGVAVDATSNVYVVDGLNRRVLKYTASGDYLAQWGSLGSGDGEFEGPSGIAIDAAGTVYVTDRTLRRVQKFTSAGVYLGEWSTIPQSTAELAGGIAVDGTGAVYVCSSLPLKYDSNGAYLGVVGTGNILQDPPGTFNMPDGIATGPDNAVYVADPGRSIGQVQKFSSSASYLLGWTASEPSGVAVSASGDVYVVQRFDNNIRKFDSSGTQTGGWSLAGGFTPAGQVAVAPNGDVYVTSAFRQTVTRYGNALTPVARTTWGRIKATYR